MDNEQPLDLCLNEGLDDDEVRHRFSILANYFDIPPDCRFMSMVPEHRSIFD